MDSLILYGQYIICFLYIWLVIAYTRNQFGTKYNLFYNLLFYPLLCVAVPTAIIVLGIPTQSSRNNFLAWVTYSFVVSLPLLNVVLIAIGKKQIAGYARPVDVLLLRPPLRDETGKPVAAQSLANNQSEASTKVVVVLIIGITALVTAISVTFTSLQTCNILDTATGRSGCLAEVTVGNNSIQTINFSPDGTKLAIGGPNSLLQIIEVDHPDKKIELKGVPTWTDSTTFSPDGSVLATGSWDGGVRLWQVSDGKLLRTIGIPTDSGNATMSLAFSPDGKLLATDAYKTSARVWRVADGALLKELPTSDPVVAFSPDGTLLATTSDNGFVIWQVQDWTRLKTLPSKEYSARELSFSPDSKTLIANNYSITLWDINEAKLIRKFDYEHTNVYRSGLSFGSKLVVGSIEKRSTFFDYELLVWNLETGHQLYKLDDQSHFIDSVAVSKGGKLAASAMFGAVRIWKLHTD